MEILKDKSFKTYDHLSRYTSFPVYYNIKDDKYFHGIISQLDKEKKYVLHEVKPNDTLESLALKYYGRPDYYWIIGLFNNIGDSFEKLYNKYDKIKVPTISNIEFK